MIDRLSRFRKPFAKGERMPHVRLRCRPVCALPVAATGEINKAVVETFRGRDLVIPFPQREVRILGGSAA